MWIKTLVGGCWIGLLCVPLLLFAPINDDQYCDLPLVSISKEEKLAAWMARMPFDIPSDARLERQIQRLHRSRSLAEKMRLSARYLPQIDRHLKTADLPWGLRYLPMVESGFHPGQVSPTGAAGLWQMMPRTARKYGLTVNSRLDERYDAERSCIVAMRILHRLHHEFKDWTLSVAAYNCGPTRMRRILRETGATSFSEIEHLLPLQTRQYLRKIVAAAYVHHQYLHQ